MAERHFVLELDKEAIRLLADGVRASPCQFSAGRAGYTIGNCHSLE
jgi:hypothetical protein